MITDAQLHSDNLTGRVVSRLLRTDSTASPEELRKRIATVPAGQVRELAGLLAIAFRLPGGVALSRQSAAASALDALCDFRCRKVDRLRDCVLDLTPPQRRRLDSLLSRLGLTEEGATRE